MKKSVMNSDLKLGKLTTSHNLPAVISFDEPITKERFVSWFKSNTGFIEESLLASGAVLFKGVEILDVNYFQYIMDEVCPRFMSYIDGFSPRTKLSSNVYTSTEYDQDFYITPHNELSFSYKWPSKLYFCCITPSPGGGETPLGDCRIILKNMDPDIVRNMEQKGVKYIRNLHGGKGAGPSWQETFETNDKNKVEAFCENHETKFEWKADGGLKVVQYRNAIIMHPETKEKVWFNQVDQFHPSQFNREIYEALMMMYNDDEESLPMYSAYGDDSKIPEETILRIRKTVDESVVTFPWEKSDLLLVDNVLVCHGRKPYSGQRKVLVSMAP
jgi:hypothetical protein